MGWRRRENEADETGKEEQSQREKQSLMIIKI
jgi:hypothetical protein